MKTYQDQETADVRAFQEKFRQLVNRQPVHLTLRKLKERIEFLQEELDEFDEAAAFNDLVKMFDALLDLVYVAKGTAVMMGLPWEEGWAEVQRSNMEKVIGVTHRGHAVDVKKPPGWRGPDLASVIAFHGYDPDRWLEPPDAAGWRSLKPGLGVDDADQMVMMVDEGNAPARVAGTPPQCGAFCPAEAPYGIVRMACRLRRGHLTLGQPHEGQWPACQTGPWSEDPCV